MVIGADQQDEATGAEPSAGGSVLRRLDSYTVFGASLVALLLRFLTLPAMTGDGLRLVSMDDYGHLRRAMATLADFPRVPAFDPYLHHPEGAIWIWPPGFDFGIAAIARLLFGAGADLAEVTLVAALVPPILGALTIWPLFAFARRTIGLAEARWAVIFYAVLPAAVVWSSFGHGDQHCAEALALVLVFVAFSRLFIGEDREGGGGALADDWLGVALAALALSGAVLIWQGAVFVVPIVALAAVLARRPFPAAVSLLLAATLVAIFAWAYPGPITYVSFGRFQPLFLVLWAGLLGVVAVPRWGLALAVTGGSVVALSWPPIADGVRHLLSATSGGGLVAGGYDVYPKEWLQLIFEYRPLFSSGMGRPLGELSGGLLALPPVALWWAWRVWRLPSERARLALPLIAMCALTAMALSQRRYVYYLSVMVALALAVAVVHISRRVSRGRWLAAALVFLALAPIVRPLARQTRIGSAAGDDVFWTLEALGALDPPGVEPFGPTSVAAGEVPGVLAPWSLGHLVTLFTGRPAVADNFGYGFERQSWIYTAPPEADREVARKLDRWNCRYLITADLDSVLVTYAEAVGHGSVPPDRMLVNRVHRSGSRRPLEFLELVLVSRTGSRMADGSFLPRLKVFRIRVPENWAASQADEGALRATPEDGVLR